MLTQGRTLAAMQVSGCSQLFNAVNALRILGPLDADGRHPQPVERAQGLY